MTPAPRPRAEPSPALPPRRSGPAADRQDELPAAASSSAGPQPQHDTPAPAITSPGTRPGRAPEPTALPQPAATPDPLTDDDIFLGISRLPAFVIGDLFHAVDTSQPLASVSRQLAPYSAERAAGEPDPGAREAVTAEPAGLHIQVDHAGTRRTGLITWQQIDDLLRPGTTPARRQIVTQARQVRVGFMAANASFCAVGEGRLAAAAEDELRAEAAAAVTAILAAAHPAAAARHPRPRMRTRRLNGSPTSPPPCPASRRGPAHPPGRSQPGTSSATPATGSSRSG